jgi:hypothetical protein
MVFMIVHEPKPVKWVYDMMERLLYPFTPTDFPASAL